MNSAGKRERDIHRDAQLSRELQRKPAAHPEALHDDQLRLERRTPSGTSSSIGQRSDEQFEPIGPVKVKPRHANKPNDYAEFSHFLRLKNTICATRDSEHRRPAEIKM